MNGFHVLTLCDINPRTGAWHFRPEVLAWCRATLNPGWRVYAVPGIHASFGPEATMPGRVRPKRVVGTRVPLLRLLQMELICRHRGLYGRVRQAADAAPLMLFHNDSDLLAFRLRWL